MTYLSILLFSYDAILVNLTSVIEVKWLKYICYLIGISLLIISLFLSRKYTRVRVRIKYGYYFIWYFLLLIFPILSIQFGIIRKNYASLGFLLIVIMLTIILQYNISVLNKILNVFMLATITFTLFEFFLYTNDDFYQTYVSEYLRKYISYDWRYQSFSKYVPVAIIILLSFNYKKQSKKVVILVILAMITQLLSLKRGPLISLIIAVIFTNIYINIINNNYKISIFKIFKLLTQLSIVLFFAWILFPNLFSVFSRFSIDNNADISSHRFDIWIYLLDLSKKYRLIGIGFANTGLINNNLSAENHYIGLLLEIGLPGALTYFIFFIDSLIRILKVIKIFINNKLFDSYQNSKFHLLFSLMFQVFFLINGLTIHAFYISIYCYLYFMSTSITLYYYREVKYLQKDILMQEKYVDFGGQRISKFNPSLQDSGSQFTKLRKIKLFG
jgi:hypothetical protein